MASNRVSLTRRSVFARFSLTINSIRAFVSADRFSCKARANRRSLSTSKTLIDVFSISSTPPTSWLSSCDRFQTPCFGGGRNEVNRVTVFVLFRIVRHAGNPERRTPFFQEYRINKMPWVDCGGGREGLTARQPADAKPGAGGKSKG